jgi:hypothetical protein
MEPLFRQRLGLLAVTDKRCLVVLDDLTDPTAMSGLWPAGHGQVIVTTRRRDAALTGGGRTLIDVDIYTVEEANAYLSERLGPFLDPLLRGLAGRTVSKWSSATLDRATVLKRAPLHGHELPLIAAGIQPHG